MSSAHTGPRQLFGVQNETQMYNCRHLRGHWNYVVTCGQDAEIVECGRFGRVLIPPSLRCTFAASWWESQRTSANKFRLWALSITLYFSIWQISFPSTHVTRWIPQTWWFLDHHRKVVCAIRSRSQLWLLPRACA